MKAVIIEDETTAVNSLKAILAQNTVTPIEVIAELESIEESVEFFRTSPHPDIIFMDIHLADGSAFKIFEQVEIDAPVVFTTAYDEYALQAFQVSSIDYLLKPVTLVSLERALNKLRLFDTEERLAHIRQTNRTIQSRHTVRSLLIMLADKFYPLPAEEILYFYTANGLIGMRKNAKTKIPDGKGKFLESRKTHKIKGSGVGLAKEAKLYLASAEGSQKFLCWQKKEMLYEAYEGTGGYPER